MPRHHELSTRQSTGPSRRRNHETGWLECKTIATVVIGRFSNGIFRTSAESTQYPNRQRRCSSMGETMVKPLHHFLTKKSTVGGSWHKCSAKLTTLLTMNSVLFYCSKYTRQSPQHNVNTPLRRYTRGLTEDGFNIYLTGNGLGQQAKVIRYDIHALGPSGKVTDCD